jgi:hypothetical protein
VSCYHRLECLLRGGGRGIKLNIRNEMKDVKRRNIKKYPRINYHHNS